MTSTAQPIPQCTRAAVTNRLCKQHNDMTHDVGAAVLDTGLPAELACTVLLYNDTTITTDIKLQDYLSREQVRTLQQWCSDIGVRTPWHHINPNQYPHIQDIYTHRLDDYPDPVQIMNMSSGLLDYEMNKEGIDLDTLVQVRKRFNPYLYYSTVIFVVLTSTQLDVYNDTNGDVSQLPLYTLNSWLHQYHDVSAIRAGDVVCFGECGSTRPDNGDRDLCIYDGSSLQFLDTTSNDGYAQLPRSWDIATFPTTNYFEYSLYFQIAWLHTNVPIESAVQLDRVTKLVRADGIVIYADTQYLVGIYAAATKILCYTDGEEFMNRYRHIDAYILDFNAVRHARVLYVYGDVEYDN